MVMSIPVEKVEKGDRIEVWLEDAPKVVVVGEITEGVTIRTFQVSHSGAAIELNIQRGHTVNLTC